MTTTTTWTWSAAEITSVREWARNLDPQNLSQGSQAGVAPVWLTHGSACLAPTVTAPETLEPRPDADAVLGTYDFGAEDGEFEEEDYDLLKPLLEAIRGELEAKGLRVFGF